MPGGRPTIYDPNLCLLLAEALKKGTSIKRFCRDNNISKSAFYRWLDEKPELKEALRAGEGDRDAWWEDLGLANITNRDFNTPLYKFLVFLHCGICEKRENELTVTAKEDTIKAVRNAESAYK